jgi:hypothetical protein
MEGQRSGSEAGIKASVVICDWVETAARDGTSGIRNERACAGSNVMASARKEQQKPCRMILVCARIVNSDPTKISRIGRYGKSVQ